MFDRLEVYRDSDPHSAALNMAVDEALLEASTSPTLRFYRWERPALSFGYFGLFSDVSNERPGRDVVRRWTGGGVVPHGKDLTYSVVVPKSHPLLLRSSPEIYSQLHEAIRQALAAHGIATTLASTVAPKVSEHCFANAVRADLLSGGQKIAGAAHRRSRAGLLHQGSIQLPRLPATFVDDLATTLCDRSESRVLSPELLARAGELARTKYGTEDWLMRR